MRRQYICSKSKEKPRIGGTFKARLGKDLIRKLLGFPLIGLIIRLFLIRIGKLVGQKL